MKTLIPSDSNVHGRSLVQDGDALYVLSGCCDSTIKSQLVDSVSNKTFAVCAKCGIQLQENPIGFVSRLPDVRKYLMDRPSSWARWGKFWFDFDDFAMGVEDE